VETHDLLCSPAGKTFVEDTIRARSPGTVVVAACSPKMHEKTFGDAAQNAGLNMAKVAMANIREPCAWVTADKSQATRKAQSLIAAGIAHSTNLALAGLCNTEVDAFGFLKPDHGVLHATGTTIDGICAAGCVSSPCDSATAVSRAHAAAGHALSRLVPGRRIELEVLTCSIDAERCAGCKLCIAVCPYKAIAYDQEKAVSVITEAICRGCGACAATCPGGAASAKHFTDTQICAELGGVLNG
jgi:heterodisulfide reductase subunit A-like polyferredoxin